MSKSWTKEEESELLKYISAGFTFKDCAESLKRSYRSVERKLFKLRQAGKAEPVYPKKPHNEPAAIEDDPSRLAYWRNRAKTLEKEVTKLEKISTAQEIIAEEFTNNAPAAYDPPPFRQQQHFNKGKRNSAQSAVLLFSDAHIGAVVKSEQTLDLGRYDFEIFLRRLYRLERSIFSILQDHTATEIPEIVIPMIGDMLDGALVHAAECGQANTILSQFYAGGHAIAQFFRNLSTIAPLRIYGVVGNHCVDETTEILTQRGWLTSDQVTTQDQCLGLNAGKAAWQPVNSIHRDKQVDRMVTIKNKMFDFRGTEHHRFYFRPWSGRGVLEAPWSDIETLVTKHHGIEIPSAAHLEGTGEGVPDQLIELAGAVLTDGSISGDSNVIIFQSKNTEWIERALALSGLQFSKRTRTRKSPVNICGRPWKGGPTSTEYSFRLASKDARLFLQQTGLEKGKLPAWVWNMTHSQFERFLGALLAGDGTQRSDDGAVLYGKSKEWLGDVQALAALHGWSASVKLYRPNNDNLNPQHRLLLRRSCWISVGNKASVTYSEPAGESVWCVRTNSENWLCRRNGIAYFTGNTRWGHQHKMPSKNRNSNFDMLLYLYIQALTRDIERIEWNLNMQPFATFEVQGFHFYAAHGDSIRGGDKTLGLPAHSMGRMISTTTQLFTRAQRPSPDYFLLGHLHRPIEVPHAKGAVIVNGAFPGIDGYALTEYFNSSHPVQKFWLMHKVFGRSATYDLRLDLGDDQPHGFQIPTDFTCV